MVASSSLGAFHKEDVLPMTLAWRWRSKENALHFGFDPPTIDRPDHDIYSFGVCLPVKKIALPMVNALYSQSNIVTRSIKVGAKGAK